ncbi:MAG: RDD family protein [Alphaproteobacteria bacterium]|nr:RDD family protein [Alphaproteobacteria bacterium]MCB9693524.1 RDD family protein [Alphaproteobacteria bacterium]
MFDPLTGASTFVEYGVVWQWLRAGAISTLLLGMAAPIVAQVLYIVALGDAVYAEVSRRDAQRYERAVGPAAVPMPLVVRKRTKSGARAAAIPVEVVPGALWRRAGARLVDNALVAFTAVGGLMAGELLVTGGLGLPTFDLFAVGLSAFVVCTLFLARWRGVHRSGQTLGKVLLDVHVAAPEGPLTGWRQVFLREILPDIGSFVGATLGALFAGPAVIGLLYHYQIAELFDLPVVVVFSTILGWPFAFVGMEMLWGLPLLGTTRSIRDFLGGTVVVRTQLVDTDVTAGGHLFGRVVARLIDHSLLPLTLGIPWAITSMAMLEAIDPLHEDLWFSVPFALFTGPAASPGLVLGGAAVALLGQIVVWTDLARTGTTPGKRALGLRVVSDDEVPVDWVRVVLVREVMAVWLFWGLLPFVGPLYDLLTGALDRSGRTLHDRIAGTRVVASRDLA